MTAAKRLIAQASKWIGYLEKKSNKDLDDFTANAGSNNYTRFNRDLIAAKVCIGAQPMQWCGAFVSCCFLYEFGLATAQKLLCGNLHCYTPTGANYFKKKGRYIYRGKGTPKPGDVVFFYSTSKGRIGHVGIVEKVVGNKVYTIEGNTSGASTLVTNGGGVRRKSYNMSSSYIDGYGSVDYTIVGDTIEAEFVDDMLKKGDANANVKELQGMLLKWNPDCLPKYGADGDFGSETEKALKAYQKEKGLTVDGVCDMQTWNSLKGAKKMVNVSSGTSVFVRNGAGANYSSVGVVHKGESFEWVETDEKTGWYRIKYENSTAWITNKYTVLVCFTLLLACY